jgi:hypothetical protein
VGGHADVDPAVGIPWPTILAFLRISTHPRARARPLALDVAWSVVQGWLDRPNVRCPVPTERHRGILGELMTAGHAVGDHATDCSSRRARDRVGARVAERRSGLRSLPRATVAQPARSRGALADDPRRTRAARAGFVPSGRGRRRRQSSSACCGSAEPPLGPRAWVGSRLGRRGPATAPSCAAAASAPDRGEGGSAEPRPQDEAGLLRQARRGFLPASRPQDEGERGSAEPPACLRSRCQSRSRAALRVRTSRAPSWSRTTPDEERGVLVPEPHSGGSRSCTSRASCVVTRRQARTARSSLVAARADANSSSSRESAAGSAPRAVVASANTTTAYRGDPTEPTTRVAVCRG